MKGTSDGERSWTSKHRDTNGRDLQGAKSSHSGNETLVDQVNPGRAVSTRIATVTPSSRATLSKNLPRPWKPVTLKAPMLLSIVTVSFILIATLEVLSWTSRTQGGIAFAQRNGKMSGGQTFSYLYLPTIIAVCYSMLWSWIDLDAKRLEPFFQLSKPDGTVAQNSVLLHYPFDFIAVAPIRAARRRHWAVFYAGTGMALIFWVVTPLQSAIFNQDTVIVSTPVTTVKDHSFVPMVEQTGLLNASFMQTSYGIVWQGGNPPKFTTEEFALAPFTTTEQTSTLLKSEKLTSTTTMYTTDIFCHPAIFSESGALFNHSGYSNGKGCIAQVTMPVGGNYSGLYIGYYDNAAADWSLFEAGCPKNASSNFLALWKQNKPVETETTALFCETSYYSQEVNATVAAADNSVLSMTPLRPRQKMQDDGPFNITNFEYLLSTGVPPTTDRKLPSIWMDDTVVEQFPRLSHISLSWPITNMVGFGVGLLELPPDQYLKPGNLESAFRRAHKLLFAVAVSTLMKATNENVETGTGRREYQVEAIVVVRPFSIVVECFLALVALLALLLLVTTSRRSSKLSDDPASISSVLSLASSNKELLNSFKGCDVVSTKDLEARLRNRRFKLHRQDSRLKLGTQDVAVGADHTVAVVESSTPERGDGRMVFEPVRPAELGIGIGFLFLFTLFLSIVTLSVVYTKIARNNGLPRPSNNAIIRQLALNYVPTAFATFLEPFWVLLNRLLCILQPFEELRKGGASRSSSLDAKYTSLPPQLIMWRAARAGHYLLTVVCCMALSANVLAVSMSGLFQESFSDLERPVFFKEEYGSVFNRTALNNNPSLSLQSQQDHWYIIKANITEHVPLPAWTTPEFYFPPFQAPIKSTDDEKYKAVTRGFGTSLECHELNVSDVQNNFTFTISDDPCITSISMRGPSEELTGRLSTEFFSPGVGSTSIYNTTTRGGDTPSCEMSVTAGWVRATIEQNTTTFYGFDGTLLPTAQKDSISQMFMFCKPKLKTAFFEVTVDARGHVLLATQIGDFDNDVHRYFEGNESDLYMQFHHLVESIFSSLRDWHADASPQNWPSYLFQALSQNPSMSNPGSPPPEFSQTVGTVQSIYQRLFAVVLSLQPQCLLPASPDKAIAGTVIIGSYRVFMSLPMFYVSIVILSSYFMAALLLYLSRPMKFLPRMPITIASIVALFYASHAAAEEEPMPGKSSMERRHCTNKNGRLYGFGKYVGTDGRIHIGIERQPLFVPLESTTFYHRTIAEKFGSIGPLRGRELKD